MNKKEQFCVLDGGLFLPLLKTNLIRILSSCYNTQWLPYIWISSNFSFEYLEDTLPTLRHDCREPCGSVVELGAWVQILFRELRSESIVLKSFCLLISG